MHCRRPPTAILNRYIIDSSKAEVTSLGEGNINDTFLVQTTDVSIVLQRINSHVFPEPQILIDNLHHLSSHLVAQTANDVQHWQETVLVPTIDGAPSVTDHDGFFWRALSYIHDSISVSNAQTALHAEQTGWALGHFHKRLVGLDATRIRPPLPGFHNLTHYLKQYQKTVIGSVNTQRISPDGQFCLNTIRDVTPTVFTLEQALAKGTIRRTTIHGDPKIANVLFHKENGLAISLIDLDTVGPGILQHDIGDCLRSVCNSGGEQSTPETAAFDLDLCKLTLQGYFSETGKLLTIIDKELIYDGIKTITFELGLRFFTDYLQGGIYFKCNNIEETLQKALVQFMLLRDIIAQQKDIRKLCSQL